jgi:ferric iron reductase protein FhuF
MPLSPLERAMFESFSKFGRIGSSYRVYFEQPSYEEVVSCEEALDPDRLRTYFTRAIKDWSDHPGEEDQRAAASRFLRRYCGSIAAATTIPLANGVALDVSIPRVSLLVRNDMMLGTVLDRAGAREFVSPERPTTWPIDATPVPTVGELRTRAFESLFRDNLVPAFERIREAIGVSTKLLWSTAAESIEYGYEHARPYYDDLGWVPIEQDRAAIHFADTVAGVDGPNPMRGLLEWEDYDDPEVPGPLQVRRICCVNYVVPGREPRYCRTCGLLTTEQRHELWRLYHKLHREETECRWPPTG